MSLAISGYTNQSVSSSNTSLCGGVARLIAILVTTEMTNA